MKTKLTFWRVFVAIAAIVLASLGMTACDMGVTRRDAVGGGHAPGFMGEIMGLSGQVWMRTWSGGNYVEIPWSGSTGVVGRFYNMHGNFIGTGGGGSIINGQLDFTIGTPPGLQTGFRNIFYMDGIPMFYNLQVSDAHVGFQSLGLETTGGDFLERVAGGGNIWEFVVYIFVDRNVTIMGTGRTITMPCDCWRCDCVRWDGVCFCGGIITSQNMHLNLRRGWNALHIRQVLGGAQGGIRTGTISYSAGDIGHARWVFYNW